MTGGEGIKEKGVIDVDGSMGSGSGTIIRYSISMAAILGRPVRIKGMRAKRKKPGLRPQHLRTVQACCDLTDGTSRKAAKDSLEMTFSPGPAIRGGEYSWDIGTAGSATMMGMGLLPLGLFAEERSVYTITGGLFQDHAPDPFHMKWVLLELLKKMGAGSDLEILRPGYVPKGGGALRIRTLPLENALSSIRMTEQGKVEQIRGIAISSHLEDRDVSRRMRDACAKLLSRAGYSCDIGIINDTSAAQKGAALFISASTDTGCIIGSDMAGRPGRRSEDIGRHVARSLIEDIDSGSTVDRYTQDQLLLYAALAEGESRYKISRITEHFQTNMQLARQMAGAEVSLNGNTLSVKGAGIRRR